jgi:hypothetical protein
MTTVVPQLDFNDGAFRKLITEGSKSVGGGAVSYLADRDRLDDFFTALSCGLIYKSCGSALPANYSIAHIYHSLQSEASSALKEIVKVIDALYSEEPMAIMDFGALDAKNGMIYSVKIFGVPNFQSSITIVHLFSGR